MENFIELLKKRRSCRRFTDEPVNKESIEHILKAALTTVVASVVSWGVVAGSLAPQAVRLSRSTSATCHGRRQLLRHDA